MKAAIIQARVGSKRLPNKILLKVKGKTLLELMLERVKLAKRVDKIILAIPNTPENDCLEKLGKECGVLVYRGSEDDVLSRYYHAAKKFKADVIIRLTSDCPLICPKLLDRAIEMYEFGEDYFTNCITRTYPDGEDIEIMSFSALARAYDEARDLHDLEHVTTYLGCRPEEFTHGEFRYHEDLSKMRWTLDYREDYLFIKRIFEEFHPRVDFSMEEILDLLKKNPEIAKLNANVVGKDNLKIAQSKLSAF